MENPDRRVWTDLGNRAFLTLWFTQLLSGLLIAPLFTLFPIYVKSVLGESALLTACLRAVFVALGGLVALPGGVFADTFGRKRTYLLGLTGTLGAGAMFLVESPLLLWALAVYAGLMFGVGTVGGQSYLMGSVPRSSLGLATAGYFMSGTLGSALGNLLGGRIADLHPHQGYTYLGLTILVGESLLWTAALLWLPSVPRPEKARTLEAVLRGSGHLLRRPGVPQLMALRFLPTVYWGAATLLIPLLIHRAAGTNRAAGDYASISLAAAASCQVLTGRWIDRRGSMPAVLTCISLVTLSAWLLGLRSDSLTGIYLFGVLGAASAWSLSITMPGLVRDLAPEAETGRLLGATHLMWSAGFLTGSLLGGAWEATDPARAILVSAGACAVGIGCAASLMVSRRGVETRREDDREPAGVGSGRE